MYHLTCFVNLFQFFFFRLSLLVSLLSSSDYGKEVNKYIEGIEMGNFHELVRDKYVCLGENCAA